jgi:2'-5' RNA ligase
MSERTTAALAVLDRLLPALSSSQSAHREQLIEETEALRRAVAAFHMEAIRFRMFSVDRLIRMDGDPPALRGLVEELRHELESAGFHTRSHTAP